MTQTQHTDGSVEYTASEELIHIPVEPAAPADQREAAYRAQADQYLTACEGYRVELEQAEAAGDHALAAALRTEISEQKTLYLAAKAAIRTQYPDNQD